MYYAKVQQLYISNKLSRANYLVVYNNSIYETLLTNAELFLFWCLAIV